MRRTAVFVVILALAAGACSSSGRSTSSTTTHATPISSIRVVNQNLLHGNACPADSQRCDLSGRVGLFVRQLGRAKCPELVAIEEANTTTERLLLQHLSAPCGYRSVYDDDPSQDRELVLTTLPVLGSERRRLAGPLRTAYWVRVATSVGPVDLVATHLASSSDDRPCDATTCPPPCAAADSIKACQGRQAVAFLAAKRGPRSVAILAGDLNAKPDEPTITEIERAGLVDTHRVIGNTECDTHTGVDCTSGRIDDSMVDLENPNSRQTERIDYVFLTPSPRCRVGRPTGLFAAEGGPTSAGNPLMFPADHSGVEATILCHTSAADRAAAKPARTTTTTRPTASAHALSATVKESVAAAFTNLFAPNPDPDAQLATLENAAALRESFIARKAQVGDLANRTAVRIDAFGPATATTVDVTFSILLDGNVVLDALPGHAVRVNGRWLVTTSTYCQVATLGTTTIPEACAR